MTNPNRVSEHLSPARPVALRRPWVHGDEAACRRISELVGAESHVWQLGHICVLSSAERAEYRGEIVPHNHVSISVLREKVPGDRRPTDREVQIVRHDFDMEDAEEDNHQPGRVRNLFLPLHLPRGSVGICDCKVDEEQVVEADGFTWSRQINA